tara:strand:+ start:407 stop:748 length:342 start_codon:yes stop_codon:yes gene_type:complete
MSGKRSRDKGKRGERAVAELFREAMPGDSIKRGIQTRDGSEVADVTNCAFFIEVKNQKKPNIRAALAQAAEACGERKLWPIAVTKDTRGSWRVTLELADFLELVAEWWTMRRE